MTKKKRKKILYISGGILALIIILLVWQGSRGPEPVYSTVEALRASLLQTVSETGTVKPLKKLDLNFPQVGKISKIEVAVGDRVVKGQVLAELENDSLLIREQEAIAALDLAVNNKNKLISGATATEIAVMQAQVNQARSAYQGASEDYSRTLASVEETIRQAEKRLADLEDKTANTPTALEQSVVAAQLNLENGRATYQQSINNSENNFLTSADYSVSIANTAIDKVATVLDDEDLNNVFSIKNLSYKNQTEFYYDQAKGLRSAAEAALDAARIDGTEEKFNALNVAVSSYLNSTFKAANNCYSALENSIVYASLTQTEMDSFKASISAQITAVNAGVSSLQGAKYNLDNSFLSYKNNIASLSEALRQVEVNLSDGLLAAQNSLSSARLTGDKQINAAKMSMNNAKETWGVAERQLSKLKAPARSEDINLADAQIKQAQANLDLVKKQQEDSILKAPIDGQIVSLNYEMGEQFSAAKPMFSMLTENDFEIEVDISETDISKIKVGDFTEITFDAFGENYKFDGKVYSVEPSATVIQGVIYYKVKITIATPSEDSPANDKFSAIKPEMTANITINTDRRDEALVVPGRAVVDKNGQGKFVRVLEGKTVKEVPVSIGLSGDEGLVEIIQGEINPGDLIITFIK